VARCHLNLLGERHPQRVYHRGRSRVADQYARRTETYEIPQPKHVFLAQIDDRCCQGVLLAFGAFVRLVSIRVP
jgi:hypothetical protein